MQRASVQDASCRQSALLWHHCTTRNDGSLICGIRWGSEPFHYWTVHWVQMAVSLLSSESALWTQLVPCLSYRGPVSQDDPTIRTKRVTRTCLSTAPKSPGLLCFAIIKFHPVAWCELLPHLQHVFVLTFLQPVYCKDWWCTIRVASLRVISQ